MFAATQHFLTNAFCFTFVCSLVGLALELAYFLASTPTETPREAPEEQSDVESPAPVRYRPMVAPTVARALTVETLESLGVVKLRKVALARGVTGAGRWRKAQILAQLGL